MARKPYKIQMRSPKHRPEWSDYGMGDDSFFETSYAEDRFTYATAEAAERVIAEDLHAERVNGWEFRVVQA